MKILGIDPGTQRIGFGCISEENGRVACLETGILMVRKESDPDSLLDIKMGIDRLLSKYSPECLAIEKLFFSKNQKTAMRVAEARGIVLLSAAEAKIPVREFSPNEIKMNIAGYGGADKKSVLKMVKLHIQNVPEGLIDDAGDALAVALLAHGVLKREYLISKS